LLRNWIKTDDNDNITLNFQSSFSKKELAWARFSRSAALALSETRHSFPLSLLSRVSHRKFSFSLILSHSFVAFRREKKQSEQVCKFIFKDLKVLQK
jgi:hypothetical protein